MGRRAKKAPVVTKKRPKLSKRFKCPFCSNEDTVECKMDFKAGIGSLNCRLCGAAYQMPIHHLHEPIDVFSEWLDDCEAAANGGGAAGGGDLGGGGAGGSAVPGYQDEEGEDDDIPESSGLDRKRSSKKPSAKSSSSRQSIELGLDDSEDDDDDDEK